MIFRGPSPTVHLRQPPTTIRWWGRPHTSGGSSVLGSITWKLNCQRWMDGCHKKNGSDDSEIQLTNTSWGLGGEYPAIYSKGFHLNIFSWCAGFRNHQQYHFSWICLLFYHPGVPSEYPHQGSDFAIGDGPMSMFQVLRLHEKDMINLTKSEVHSVRLTVLNDFWWHPWIAEWLVGYFHHRQEGCIGVKTMLPNHSHPRKQTLT